LMRRLNLSEEEAFRRLQRQSQDSNRKLAQVAEAIVVADQFL
jgi:AmiR/NasT family two-component response regulator